jgi:YHS domain-containing protein
MAGFTDRLYAVETNFGDPIMHRHLLAPAMLFVAVAGFAAVVSAAVKEPSAASCPVSGKGCNPEQNADFAGGTVYFCCGNCEKAFASNPEKFAAKAHHQLVSTGQLVQKGCPFSGGPMKAGTEVAIDGVEVGFCCNNCKGKVEKAADAERITMVFSSVEKGFAPAENKAGN